MVMSLRLKKHKPRKANPERNHVILPAQDKLALLFEGHDELPPSKDCYELLWLANKGNKFIQCPKCHYASAYKVSNASDKAHIVYECEYGFCKNRVTLTLGFIPHGSRNNWASAYALPYYLKLAYLCRKDPAINTNKLATELEISWPAADAMLKRLQPYM